MAKFLFYFIIFFLLRKYFFTKKYATNYFTANLAILFIYFFSFLRLSFYDICLCFVQQTVGAKQTTK